MPKEKSSRHASTVKRTSRLALAEDLGLDGIARLHTRLKNCAAKCINVNINASRVESIDTACLQLLTAFLEQVRDNGNTVSWLSPSDALIRAAELAGLDTQLNLA